MLKQAMWHRQAALRAVSSRADHLKARNIKLKRNEKKQTHVKQTMPTQVSKGGASKQKTSVSAKQKISSSPTMDLQAGNGDNEKIFVRKTRKRESTSKLAVSKQPACTAPSVLQEPVPKSTGPEFLRNQTRHSKNIQSKPNLSKTENVAVVVEENNNKNRLIDVSTPGVRASSIEVIYDAVFSHHSWLLLLLYQL